MADAFTKSAQDTKKSEQVILNNSYDTDFNVLATELVGYDASAQVLRRLKVSTDGSIQLDTATIDTRYLKLTGGTIKPTVDTLTALVVNDKDSNNVLTVDTVNNRVGIGTTVPSSLLQLLGTSANQFRIGYDSSNYVTDSVSSTGANTLTLNGSNAGYGIILPVSSTAGTNLIPTMTSNTAPSGIAAASSEYSAIYKAWYAFDGVADTSHRWAGAATGFPQWLSYQFTTSQTITQYKLNSASNPTYAPKNWTFEGYNGSSWVVLDTQTNQTSWIGWNTYNISNTTAYISYRIYITANNGGSGLAVIDEMQMSSTFGSPTSMFTISNTGAIGINNTAPVSTLDIKGLAGASLFNVASPTGTSELMVSSNGNVGIGTTAPLSKLVVGNSPGVSNKLLTVSDSASPHTNAGANGILVSIAGGGGIYMSSGDVSGVEGKYEAYGGNLGIGTMSNHGLILSTNNTTRLSLSNTGNFNFNSDQIFFQQSSGNVGIGTTSPGASLDIHNVSDKVGLQIQGFSTQTNNLQEWKDSIGTVLLGITGAGFVIPTADSAIDLGSSSKYWANGYVDKIYLNATAAIDGSTGGRLTVTGNLGMTGSIVVGAEAISSGKFQIVGDSSTGGMCIQSAAGEDRFSMYWVANSYLQYDTYKSSGGRRLPIVMNPLGGNISIGTTTTTQTLNVGGNIASDTDSTDDLGTSSIYWANTYTDKLYLNATATLDGSVAGIVTVTGNLVASNLSSITQNIQLTAQVTAIGATNITGTNTAGLYRVSYNLLDTTADLAAGTIMVNFAGTDEAGAFTMSSVALPLTAVGRTQGTLFLRISNTSSVAYSTTLVGLIGTSQYALFISVEKLL